MTGFRKGTRVALLPHEDEPYQEGVVLTTANTTTGVLLVEIDVQYRSLNDPDGLREVLPTQLRRLP